MVIYAYMVVLLVASIFYCYPMAGDVNIMVRRMYLSRTTEFKSEGEWPVTKNIIYNL